MNVTFSVVLPYFNEEEYLPRTIRCWLEQDRRPDQIILVNNASTDESEARAQQALRNCPADIDVQMIYEPRPGKIHALERGCALVTGTHVVMADADTYYPSDYLQVAADIAETHGDEAVAIMGLTVRKNPRSLRSLCRRGFDVLRSRLFKRTLVGGHGQILRADVLNAVGGFSIRHWQYVLLDHEIMNRMMRYGRAIYSMRLWCSPSHRRGDRRRVRWTVFERGMYLATPYAFHDWFFYRFLGPRLRGRQMTHLNLRQQPWRDVARGPALQPASAAAVPSGGRFALAGMLGMALLAVAWVGLGGSVRTEAYDAVPLDGGIPPITLADFQDDPLDQPPARWKQHDGRRLISANWDHMHPSEYFTVAEDDGRRFVRGRSVDQAIKIILPNNETYSWDLRTHPHLCWEWRAIELPSGARENDELRNDTGAAVYVTFDKDWLGRLRTVKYTYSSTLPVGTSARYGSLRLLVVSSAVDGMGKWVSVERDVREDYRRLFGGEPPVKPTSVWLWSDSDTMDDVAQADFDNIVIASGAPE